MWENKSPTLLASVSDNMPPAICYTIDPFASNSMKSKNPNSGFHETAVARCLDTTSASPACNQGGNVVVLQGSMIGRADENGPNGAGIAEGACFCLTATDRHAVVVEHHPNDSRINISESDTVQTLTGRMGTGGGNVPLVMLEE